MQNQVSMRAEDHTHTRVVVGMATCGIASGARPVLTALSNLVQERGLTDRIAVTQTGCIGLCQYEPIVEVMEPGKAQSHLYQDESGESGRGRGPPPGRRPRVEEYTLASADIK